MQDKNIEIKIGIVTFVALILGSAFLLMVDEINPFQNTYVVDVTFPDAQQLLAGAPVNLAGVKVGRVQGLYVNLEQDPSQQVRVRLEIYKKFRIPTAAKFRISSAGMFGTNHVKVVVPVNLPKGTLTYLDQNNPELQIGETATSFETLMTQGQETIKKVDEILKHINSVVGDEDTKKKVKEIVSSVSASTKKLDDLLGGVKDDFQNVSKDILEITKNLKQILQENRVSVQTASANIARISSDIAEISRDNKDKITRIMSRIDTITADFEGNGEFKKSMAQIRTSFTEISENVSRITSRVKDIVENPKLEEKVHEALDSASDAAGALGKVKDNLMSVKGSLTSHMLYNKETEKLESDYYLDVWYKNLYSLRIGSEDPSTKSGLSVLQAGMKKGDYNLRAGILQDKFGVSLERDFGSKIKVGVDAFNTENPVGRLYTEYELSKKRALMIRWDDFTRKKDELLVGVSSSF